MLDALYSEQTSNYMRDRLPNITINIDVAAEVFLDRLEDIAIKSDEFDVRRLSYSDGYQILNLKYRSISPHKELSGQILTKPSVAESVRVEVRAAKWQPKPPTFETYVEAAKTIFQPLLKEYNKQYSSRRRLNVQSKADTEFRLPPKARQIFDYFMIQANKENLHPTDWENFYNFIWFCASYNVRASHEDIQSLLVKEGFARGYAEYIADIFTHGFEIAKLRY